MDYNDEFKNLCKELFKRQYTKNYAELTESLYLWLYEHSAGNIANLTALIHDAQELSIIDGTESLNMNCAFVKGKKLNAPSKCFGAMEFCLHESAAQAALEALEKNDCFVK